MQLVKLDPRKPLSLHAKRFRWEYLSPIFRWAFYERDDEGVTTLIVSRSNANNSLATAFAVESAEVSDFRDWVNAIIGPIGKNSINEESTKP